MQHMGHSVAEKKAGGTITGIDPDLVGRRGDLKLVVSRDTAQHVDAHVVVEKRATQLVQALRSIRDHHNPNAGIVVERKSCTCPTPVCEVCIAEALGLPAVDTEAIARDFHLMLYVLKARLQAIDAAFGAFVYAQGNEPQGNQPQVQTASQADSARQRQPQRQHVCHGDHHCHCHCHARQAGQCQHNPWGFGLGIPPFYFAGMGHGQLAIHRAHPHQQPRVHRQQQAQSPAQVALHKARERRMNGVNDAWEMFREDIIRNGMFEGVRYNAGESD